MLCCAHPFVMMQTVPAGQGLGCVRAAYIVYIVFGIKTIPEGNQ